MTLYTPEGRKGGHLRNVNQVQYLSNRSNVRASDIFADMMILGKDKNLNKQAGLQLRSPKIRSQGLKFTHIKALTIFISCDLVKGGQVRFPDKEMSAMV